MFVDTMTDLSNGYAVFVKRDCATCVLVSPLLADMRAAGLPLMVYTQDDPSFPDGLADVTDDTTLENSFHSDIETVPTLIRVEDGKEVDRCVGWVREEWQALSSLDDLGSNLPAMRPGCGSKSVEPGIAERLAVEFGDVPITSRRIEISEIEDDAEACYDRGWTDGLPVVPPTRERVWRMLQGTSRAPGEVVGIMPPDLVECTVEKIAVNAVMAGCKPEYMPLILAAVEGALIDEFCLHGLLATTWFSSPVLIVNGPLARRVGMNAKGNAMGQGNRANATIGRALQLIVRNVGGGRPGEVDRSCLGNPGKYTFCFAEDEEGSAWDSLAVERGFDTDASTVTLFAGDGVQPIFDQKSRAPEDLARTFALCLRSINHPEMAMIGDAILVVSPEHERVFREAGWDKARLRAELDELLLMPEANSDPSLSRKDMKLPARASKMRPGGLLIVRAGGGAGMFSAVIGGWVASGEKGSIPVTQSVSEKEAVQ
jgi:hypothetical protein